MQRIQCKIAESNSSMTINNEGKEQRAFVSGDDHAGRGGARGR